MWCPSLVLKLDGVSVLVLVQSKKRFEREWKEAEKLQMNLEKLEHDCNTTKLDVDKVRPWVNCGQT